MTARRAPRVPVRPSVSGLPAYVPGARTPVGAAAYKLSSNENPYPPLPSVVAAIADAADDVNRYPDMYASELVAAIADHLASSSAQDPLAAEVAPFRVTPENVVVGNGSVAVLQHVLEAVLEPGDQVVVPWRSFEAYPIVVAVAGGEMVPVPLTDDARLDLPAMAAAVTDRTRAVLVCTPNNPTGPAVRQDEMDAFLDAVPSDVLVVVDEAYVEFVRDPRVVDGLATLDRHRNVVLVRTFSKAYGLAGLRVGYAVARKRLARAIRATSTPFGVNHLAQHAAIASLAARDELLVRVENVVAERDRMVGLLRDRGWDLPDAQGNFVWFPLGERTVAAAAEAAAAGVLVRPFAGEGIRVSVGEPEATDLLLEVSASWR
ncbi:putative phenylalanine aminotransferase [Paraoerskovia sediminicola]|uniref:Aromatic amino acid aminotransferase n=1 Tax=Paraoerskovia sediminicola TaxID=1138587 RepID=A0ABN6X9U3_9CELL|nr:histidinol-phosphate transaminase [Paraoerskovia sediminicola]BDZ41665.1 putative phenylalanine aminotransferase [Paraoerskovia sediminicola]